MSKAPAEDEATRARLLKAAASVFSECGYAASTIRQICTKAGVNVASVNYHFGDKLGLYTEVLKHSAGPDAQLRVRAAMAAAPSAEIALRICARGLFEKVYGDKPEADLKIMTREIVNPTAAFDSVVDLVMRPQYKELCTLFGQVIGHPATSEATRLCVYSFMGQVLFYLLGHELIARLSSSVSIAKERNRIADHIVAFTIAGVKATTSASERKRK